MVILKVAIADANEAYLDRLTMVLAEYSGIRISTYTDKEILKRDIAQGKCQVLLLDPVLFSEELVWENLSAVIVLAGENAVPLALRDFPAVRKFQRASLIYKQMLAICSDKIESLGSGRNGTANVVSVYSPIGGSGKTSISLIVANKLALLNYRVLYVNFEPFASEAFFLPQTGTESLSTLLGRFHQKGDHTMFMQSCLQKKNDNLFYMNHFDSPNDYAALSAEDIVKLVTLLRKSGCFDVIVIDMESALDEKIQSVFNLSDHILLVERTDGISNIKIESFYSLAYLMEDHGDKMMRVLNFDIGRNVEVASEIPLVGRISAVANVDSASLIEDKTNSTEADFCRILVE